jgi:hypothetical protein
VLYSGGGILSDFFNMGKTKLMQSMAGDYDSTKIQEQIQTYIQSNPVLMFSFDTCPYCIQAKSILDSKNIKYVDGSDISFYVRFHTSLPLSQLSSNFFFLCSLDIPILIYVRMYLMGWRFEPNWVR